MDARLRDNMDTRGALDVLLDLILRTNKYMEQRSESSAAGVVIYWWYEGTALEVYNSMSPLRSLMVLGSCVAWMCIGFLARC